MRYLGAGGWGLGTGALEAERSMLKFLHGRFSRFRGYPSAAHNSPPGFWPSKYAGPTVWVVWGGELRRCAQFSSRILRIYVRRGRSFYLGAQCEPWPKADS